MKRREAMTTKLSAQKQRQRSRKKSLKRSKVAPLNSEGLDEWDAWTLSFYFPEGLYRDKTFVCVNCGALETWKVERQK
jgi:hypothetical protein